MVNVTSQASGVHTQDLGQAFSEKRVHSHFWPPHTASLVLHICTQALLLPLSGPHKLMQPGTSCTRPCYDQHLGIQATPVK